MDKSSIIEHNGQKYVKISGKMVPVTVKGNVAVIKAEDSTETRHPDGRVDVTVNVPCMQIKTKLV